VGEGKIYCLKGGGGEPDKSHRKVKRAVEEDQLHIYLGFLLSSTSRAEEGGDMVKKWQGRGDRNGPMSNSLARFPKDNFRGKAPEE